MNRFSQFPIYIVSKGRSEYMITSKALTSIGVDHFIVVEPQEVEKYSKRIKELNLLTTVIELDLSYKEKYELCDDLGLTKSTGPGPARNFAWDHAIKSGSKWHWVMDDNIKSFRIFNNNERIKVSNGKIFKLMEDFCLRFKNVSMAGPNYTFFVPAKFKRKVFLPNTRIYSCNLIRNDVPYRWRGRYNEDTILSLDMLTDGWCTIQFNMFLQEKMGTQILKGGNSDDFYFKEGKRKDGEKYTDTGTLNKSLMLKKVYPKITTVKTRYGRIHHLVDYRPFKKNKLVEKENVAIIKDDESHKLQLKVKS